MKINMSEQIVDRTLVSHIVLHCMTDTLMKEVQNVRELIPLINDDGGLKMDVVLTVNGHELDLGKFMKHWQSQVHRMIKEEAQEMIKERIGDKFRDVEDLLTDLQGRLEEEVDKRLEDWEREE